MSKHPIVTLGTIVFAIGTVGSLVAAVVCVTNGVGLEQKIGGCLCCVALAAGLGYMVWRDWFKK